MPPGMASVLSQYRSLLWHKQQGQPEIWERYYDPVPNSSCILNSKGSSSWCVVEKPGPVQF